jgi:hypothetical protein
MGIHGNHREMAAFQSGDDEGFKSIAEELQDIPVPLSSPIAHSSEASQNQAGDQHIHGNLKFQRSVGYTFLVGIISFLASFRQFAP